MSPEVHAAQQEIIPVYQNLLQKFAESRKLDSGRISEADLQLPRSVERVLCGYEAQVTKQEKFEISKQIQEQGIPQQLAEIFHAFSVENPDEDYEATSAVLTAALLLYAYYESLGIAILRDFSGWLNSFNQEFKNQFVSTYDGIYPRIGQW